MALAGALAPAFPLPHPRWRWHRENLPPKGRRQANPVATHTTIPRWLPTGLRRILDLVLAPAVTMTELTGASDETNATSDATASITPSGNKLILVTIFNQVSAGSTANAPTLSGNGLTWVQIDSGLVGTSTEMRASLFRSMGASPSTGSITISFAGQEQLRCGWIVAEFGNVDTSGSSGSGAVVQSAANNATGVTSLTVTLGAFGSANNATYGCFGVAVNEDVSPGSGFAQIDDFQVGTANRRLFAEWRSDNDTSVDCSWTTAAGCRGFAVEIKAAAAGAARTQVLVL